MSFSAEGEENIASNGAIHVTIKMVRRNSRKYK
jgi:hypothetical protein